MICDYVHYVYVQYRMHMYEDTLVVRRRCVSLQRRKLYTFYLQLGGRLPILLLQTANPFGVGVFECTVFDWHKDISKISCVVVAC